MKRFVRWLPLLILVPLWGSGLVLDRIAERALLDSVHERLVTALHAHQQHLLTVLAHQQRDVGSLAIEVSRALAKGQIPHVDKAHLVHHLPEAIGCLLLDEHGKLVTHTGAPGPPPVATRGDLPAGLAQARVTDPMVDLSGQSSYDIYLPLQATGGTLACRMKNILSQVLTEQRQGLGLTGEVYLVNAKTHLILTKSRFIPNAIGRVKVDTMGVREALKMRNGIAPYTNYRGIPVIGTFLYLRDYDWVLLAEMDEAEALAPLLRMRMVLGLSLGLISVAAGVVGWRYGRQLSEAYAEAEKARDLAQKGEAQIKALLRSAQDAIFEIDESGTIMIANESTHRMFGWPAGELLGRKAAVLMIPEDGIKHEAGLRRYLETGESRIIGKCVEVTGRRRDGTLFPCELSVAAMTLPDGRRRFVGVHRDITERLQMESRNRMLAQAMRAAIDGVVLADPQAVIIETNPAFDRMFGYERGELIGRQVSCLYPPVWLEKEFPAIAAATLETGWAGEVLGLRKDGSTFPRWVSTSPIRDPEGRLLGMLSVSRDLTERKEAEEALREANEYNRILIEASLDPITTISPDGEIKDVNMAMEAVTGVPRERLIGSDFSEYFTEPEKARVSYRKVLAEGAVRDYPLTIRHSSGRLTDVLYNATVYCNREGIVQGVYAAAHDITERKQMQDQAARVERLAALGQLLGGIAHEIKNPLFVVTGRLQLLKERLANREYATLETDLQPIEDAAKRMTAITQRFLNLARPFKPKQEICSVHDVLTQTLDFLANELMKNRIRVVRAFAPDLPRTWSEPRQLHEVFLNLILNAMQAMATAHGQGTLTITTGRKNNWIVVRIQDDGPGIAPQHHARLFEPFFSTKPPDQGTGLGLWTVRSTMAELSGTAACESKEGKGATFVVSIPVISAQPKE